jgi:hypothetical protein
MGACRSNVVASNAYTYSGCHNIIEVNHMQNTARVKRLVFGAERQPEDPATALSGG